VVPLFWDDHVQRMQSHWLVSCWTKLDNPYDDYLLWHCYAEGIFGVGITIRYGALRDFLKKECTGADHIDDFIPGYVAYGGPLKSPPFNKRKMFKNEKEIRFACQTELLANHCVNISTLKSEIGLRLSPDSTQTHRDSVRTIWTSLGGEDRIQISGE
jgi:hypothetical protein